MGVHLNQKKTQNASNGYVPSKIEWDPTNGLLKVSCDQSIRYSGLKGPFRNGPVGPISWIPNLLKVLPRMLWIHPGRLVKMQIH